MRRALVTLCDDNFVVGAEVFLKSFLHFNPWFSDEFIVIDNGISDQGKRRLEKYYDVTHKQINRKKYADINMSKTHEKLQATYYTLDVFSLYDYDRVIFMDMDMVVLDNVKELFERKDPISGAKAYNAKQDSLVNYINSGVFVVNKEILNKQIYNGLVRTAQRGYSMPDQKVINGFFKDKMTFFNKRYNVEKRMQHSKKYRYCFDEAKILHYVETKPWQSKPNAREASYEEAENIWWEWNDK